MSQPLNSESVDLIVAALVKANSAISHAIKDSKNPHFKSTFASLESVLDAVKPFYLANGIVIMQQQIENMILVTTFIHTSGQWFRSYTPIMTSSANDPQKMGSGLTYARRYSLAAMAGVGQEDDDGNKASHKLPQQPDQIISKIQKFIPSDEINAWMNEVAETAPAPKAVKPKDPPKQLCICGKSMMVSKFPDPKFPNGFYYCSGCKAKTSM